MDSFYNFRVDAKYFLDPDNDTLNYHLAVCINGLPQTTDLEWLNFDEQNIQFRMKFDEAMIGSHILIVINATDKYHHIIDQLEFEVYNSVERILLFWFKVASLVTTLIGMIIYRALFYKLFCRRKYERNRNTPLRLVPDDEFTFSVPLIRPYVEFALEIWKLVQRDFIKQTRLPRNERKNWFRHFIKSHPDKSIVINYQSLENKIKSVKPLLNANQSKLAEEYFLDKVQINFRTRYSYTLEPVFMALIYREL